jgi:hypothetical protein
VTQADPRFGVVAHRTSKAETAYFLNKLGVGWYLDFNDDLSQIPTGANKLPLMYIPNSAEVWNSGKLETINENSDADNVNMGFKSRQNIQNASRTAPPNTYWYFGGESNRHPNISGAKFAHVFHYYYTHLKIGDPNAKIIGPSILNWGYTCIGCGGLVDCGGFSLSGYRCGKAWLNEFISTYESSYGQKPPVDVWAIDVYPLDWWQTPNSSAHAQIAINQLIGMRGFLDSIPGYVNTPIWITELGVHVGYDSWRLGADDNLEPVGKYHWDKMSDYLNVVLDWLLGTGSSIYRIDKWFFMMTWTDIVNLSAGTGYMGVIFFDGPTSVSQLNCLGQIYKARAVGAPKLACDTLGASISGD